MLWLDMLSMAAGSGTGTGAVGPSAPPFGAARSTYSGSKIAITWVQGDSSSYTRLYEQVGGSRVLRGTFAPGVVGWNSGSTSLGPIYLFAYMNGIELEDTADNPV